MRRVSVRKIPGVLSVWGLAILTIVATAVRLQAGGGNTAERRDCFFFTDPMLAITVE